MRTDTVDLDSLFLLPHGHSKPVSSLLRLDLKCLLQKMKSRVHIPWNQND